MSLIYKHCPARIAVTNEAGTVHIPIEDGDEVQAWYRHCREIEGPAYVTLDRISPSGDVWATVEETFKTATGQFV